MDRASEAYRQAKQRAYRYLSARSRTKRELRERLLQLGHQADVIELVLRELEAEGYLDDRTFAHDWARYRLQTHPCGPRRLAWELQARGVERELLAEVLRSVYAEFDEATLAERALSKRVRAAAPGLSSRERGRLARYLMRLGFDPNIITATLAAMFPSQAPLDIVDSDPAC